MIKLVLAACLCLSVLGSPAALADTAPFDLAGPRLNVRVTHLGVTLPIAEVPNLSPGDQVSIKADLPPDQSVLARSLSVKLNTDCFQKMAELQAACLTQGQDSRRRARGYGRSRRRGGTPR